MYLVVIKVVTRIELLHVSAPGSHSSVLKNSLRMVTRRGSI